MKWIYKPVSIVIAILVIGPFALPLVWMSPALKRWHKAAITVLLLAVTMWLVTASAKIYSEFLKELNELRVICR